MKQLNPLSCLLLLVLFTPTALAQNCALPDGFEDNDTCQTASLFAGGLCQFGLSVQIGDADWFGFSVPPGKRISVAIRAQDPIADMKIQLRDACTPTVLTGDTSGGADASLEWENTSGSSKQVRLFLFAGSQTTVTCTFYDINVAILEATSGCNQDSFEPNNCCDIATPLGEGQHSGTIQAGDQDWYVITVPQTQNLELRGSADSDMNMTLWEDCFATFVTSSASVIRATNITNFPKTYYLQVTATGPNTACFGFDFGLEFHTGFQSFCIGDGGDGMGCTDCPCGNNSLVPNATGGCLNGTGRAARLVPQGLSMVSNPTLSFIMFEANPLSFSVLVSGSGIGPGNPGNPCFFVGSGLTSPSFDGLRCAVGGIKRHGGRPCDAQGNVGITNNRWGPPNGPTNGLIMQGGFVAGQSRYWQAIYREQPTLSCGTGLNTTQGVLTIITP